MNEQSEHVEHKHPVINIIYTLDGKSAANIAETAKPETLARMQLYAGIILRCIQGECILSMRHRFGPKTGMFMVFDQREINILKRFTFHDRHVNLYCKCHSGGDICHTCPCCKMTNIWLA